MLRVKDIIKMVKIKTGRQGCRPLQMANKVWKRIDIWLGARVCNQWGVLLYVDLIASEVQQRQMQLSFKRPKGMRNRNESTTRKLINNEKI